MLRAVSLRFFRVRLGRYSQSSNYEYGQQLFRGIKSIPYPGYTYPGHSNDLMLIKLDKKARITRAVRPISISSHCPSPGSSCLVSGWGTTSSPQGECPGPLTPTHVCFLLLSAAERSAFLSFSVAHSGPALHVFVLQ